MRILKHEFVQLYSDEYKFLLLHAIKCYFFEPTFAACVNIRRMQQTKPRIRKILYRNMIMKKYGIEISPDAKIGRKFSIMHIGNIVIGAGTIIGNGCKIYQGVTIGCKNDEYPVIGDNVTIFPGAKVIGGIKIGNNVVIGTNAVVLHDVASNCVVAGNPARVIKRNGVQ